MAKEYGPLTLPKSGKEIYFREPTGGDRLDVLKYNPIGSDDVVSGSTLVNLYLSAKCVTKVDGQQPNGDYKYLYQSWPSADADYFQQIFNRMFALDEKTLEQMDATVDFLLNGSGSTGSSTSTTSAMAQ
jgi:hypothetical protein